VDFPLHLAAIRWAEELLSLFHAYAAAGYDLASMRDSALQFDEADLMLYANTDQMPMRINGQLYAISEQAASSVVSASMLMMQAMIWEGAYDPRGVAIHCMDYVLPQLRRGRAVTIVAREQEARVHITVAGIPGQDFPVFALLVLMLALRVNSFDPNQLARESIRLIPI
jgi:hypothetical protein